jgi:hypothetical protein
VFDKVRLRGPVGSLLWGGDPTAVAAALGPWTATRGKNRRAWTLYATVTTVDTYRIRQEPLLFQARQAQRPFAHWLFPVVPNTVRVQGRALVANLGPPEG